jgi:glycosyltransferase involved in cell wall biosynthesis
VRIVFLVHQFLPRHFSGTEQLTLKLAHALRERGHDCVVVTAEPHSARDPRTRSEPDTFEGLKIHRIHGARAGANWFAQDIHNPAVEEVIGRILVDERPDIVHVNHFALIGAGFLRVAAGLALPVIFTATDFWWICPMSRLELADGSICSGPDQDGGKCLAHLAGLTLARRLPALAPLAARTPSLAWTGLAAAATLPGVNRTRSLSQIGSLTRRPAGLAALAPLIDLVLAPTEPVYRALAEGGFPEKRLRLAPHAVARSPVEPAPPRDGALTIGFIGSLLPHKGAHVLIEALTHVPSDLGLTVAVYGDADMDFTYSERLRTAAEGLPHRVEFRGTFPEPRFPDILRELDVIVLPSIWMENRPLTLLTALHARRPVVVSDMPGMTCEVTHGENGLVVPPGDAPALGRALTSLATDPGLCRALADHPRRPPDHADYVAAVEEIYGEAIARRRRREMRP